MSDELLRWLVAPVLSLATLGLLGMGWLDRRSRRFKVVEHEETEWGTMFAIVSPQGKIVGYDRWKPAQERCAALNKS